MGASFRNIQQIKALTGLDKLTISPQLIEELTNDNDNNIERIKISDENLEVKNIISEEVFRQEIDTNDMAKFKLKEGIDKFIKDTELLLDIIGQY